jgi:predicted anti-sigma-YlaC factor YlaD
MDCERVEDALTAYYFGTCEADERRLVEAHLAGCRECLSSFLRLKHELEAVEALACEGPRPEARSRLHEAYRREFGLGPLRRLMRRQVPFYQGLAAGIVLSFVLTVGTRIWSQHARSDIFAPRETAVVDTALQVPHSWHIY